MFKYMFMFMFIFSLGAPAKFWSGNLLENGNKNR